LTRRGLQPGPQKAGSSATFVLVKAGIGHRPESRRGECLRRRFLFLTEMPGKKFFEQSDKG